MKNARISCSTSGAGSTPSSSALRQVVDRDAVEELHGEHVRARQLEGTGLGHDERVRADICDQRAGSAAERTGLVAQVELLADLDAEAVEQLERRSGELVAGLADQHVEQRLHEVEVGGDPRSMPGRSTLTATSRPSWSAPGARPRSTRGRSERDRTRRTPRTAACRGRPRSIADFAEGHRRAGVEAGAELLGELVAEEARAGRDELAELDEGAAELLERQAERARRERDRRAAGAVDGREVADGGGEEAPGASPGDLCAPAQRGGARLRQVPRVDPRRLGGAVARSRAPWRPLPTSEG